MFLVRGIKVTSNTIHFATEQNQWIVKYYDSLKMESHIKCSTFITLRVLSHSVLSAL
jgi:hypothetical protein